MRAHYKLLAALSTVMIGGSPAAAGVCAEAKLQPSLAVIERMTGDGLDLSKPRLISQLFLGKPESLATLKPYLVPLGYRVQVSLTEGRLIAEKMQTVSVSWVKTTILQMCDAAERAAVDYDGWDVDVADDHIKGN